MMKNSEVKQQVENVLNVTAVKIGKMEKEKLETGQFKDTSVENVKLDLLNRQSYQLKQTIMLAVKYAHTRQRLRKTWPKWKTEQKTGLREPQPTTQNLSSSITHGG